ncbi:tail fiber domain-containing protein [Flavobacterium sp.]|uniref:tail fiber domain-containing protein n=1 Tax=Flavobacterium sp. TaxID=239 RepID=UPI00261FB6FB|nr:tail fiber domain-containing protein [Flavobacterium sp.]
MKIFSITLMLFCIQYGIAQVGINTTAPQAQLDIRSSNQAAPTNTDGVLIPKIDIFPVPNPTAAQQGMLVYLTTSTTFSGNPKPFGFYYWDNSFADWIAMGSNNPNSWNTTGNATTNSSTNFIGTTDNTDVIFKRDNTVSGRLSFSNTSFGYNALPNPLNGFNSAFGSFSLANIGSGSNNTALGNSSMLFNQNGSNNIAIGYETLRSTLSSNNIGIGNQALYTNATGEFNTALGISALQFNTGNDNTAIGYQSQLNNTTGFENVAIGKNAMLGNSSGFGNTAVGTSALAGSYSEFSTAIGYHALINNNTYDNTAVGSESMAANTFGRFNAALGKNALNANITGENNTSIGINSLKFNTSGSSNTALGSEATTMLNNLTNATAIGANAMVADSNSMVLGSIAGVNGSFNNTNVGIGTVVPSERLHVEGNIRMVDGNQAAGKILTSDTNGVASWQNIDNAAWGISGNFGTNPAVNFIGTADFTDVVFKRGNLLSGFLGSSNTSFGFKSAVTGSNNSVFGTEAFSTGSGNNNAVFGYQALGFASTCFDNVAFGTSAMISNSNGSFNVAVGSSALTLNNSGYNNTALGYIAAQNNTTGFGNTAVGSLSLNGITTGNNNTAVGTETKFNAGNLTNAAAFGSKAQVDVSNAMILGSVNGVNGATSSVNVGIGTTSPLDRLHVVGYIRMVDGNQAVGKVLTSDANGTATWGSASANTWGLTGNSGINAATNFIGTTNNADLVFKRFGSESGRIGTANTFFGLLSGSVATGTLNTYLGTEAGRDNATGQQNVFIGRRAGASGISGSDNVLIGSAAGILNTANQNTFVGSFSGNSNLAGANNTFLGYSSGSANGAGGLNTFLGAFAGQANTAGIGNTFVGSSANAASNSLTNASAVGANAFVSASNSLVLGSVSGVNGATSSVNVGIGTTTPLDRLHVAGNIRMVDGNQAAGKVLTSDANGTATWQNNSTWSLTGNSGTNDPAVPVTYGTSTIGGSENWSGTTDANDYVLGTNNIERLRIKQTTGNVGIGTSAPSRKLHVFNGASGGTPNGSAAFVLEGSAAIYQHFLAPSTAETGLLFGSDLGTIRGGVLFNNTTEMLQFRTGGNANRMVVTNAGDVGIGLVPGGQFQLSLDEGRKPGTSTWTIVSDERLKNIKGNYNKGLREILQLHPVRFHYKNSGKREFEDEVLDTEYAGFIAQEVQPLFPDAVGTDADGFLNLNIHPILIATVNAFKELNAKNEALQKENEALKASMETMNQKVEKILVEIEKLKK